jgi:rSAM/selenodomain-associated transferase 2
MPPTEASASPILSIVVPTLQEQETLPALLGDLARLSVLHEVIVADGGSTDRTAEIALAAGARLVQSPRGRGRQLAAGARAARGSVFCFLHADVRLPADALALLDRLAVSPPTGAAAFRLCIDAPGLVFRILELGTNLRSRIARLPFGDQGLVLTRALYDRVGGYPDQSLMEDVAIVRAIGRIAPVRLLPARVHVSARRWRADGVVRRTLRNWGLLASYLAGAAPERLARRYSAERDA